MALGKNTTVKVILSNVRVKTGTVDDNRLTEGMLIDLLNMNVAATAKKLWEIVAPLYMAGPTTLTLASGAYSLTSLAIDRIIKLVDATLGLILPVPPADYENISLLISQNGSTMYFVQEGESIRIFKGASLGAHGTIQIYYFKVPTYATAVTDYPDLPDSFTSLLVDMICADVTAYKNGGKRDPALDQAIAEEIKSIKESYK